MSYEKQTWKTGDKVTAEKLNHIEEGISNINTSTTIPSYILDTSCEALRRIAKASGEDIVSLPVIDGNLLVIGDSTIAGVNCSHKISYYLTMGTGYTLTDISVGGDTFAGQLNRYNSLSEIVKSSLNYVIIQLGLNDVANDIATCKTNLSLLIDTVKENSPNSRIVLSCMLPCASRWQTTRPTAWKECQQTWLALNQSIIDNEYNVDAIASLHQWAMGYYGYVYGNTIKGSYVLRPEYDTGDHIHENTAGQKVILFSWLSALFNNYSLRN